MSEKAKDYLANTIVSLIMGVGAFLIYMLATGKWNLIGLCNGFSVGGVVVVLCFLLYLVSRLGMFDMFVYGFKDVFYHMNPSKDKIRRYKDYPDYIEQKKAERKKSRVCFIPYLVVGGILLLTALGLRIAINVTMGF